MKTQERSGALPSRPRDQYSESAATPQDRFAAYANSRPPPARRTYSAPTEDSRQALFGRPPNPRSETDFPSRSNDEQTLADSDDDVEAIKQDIRFTKQESLSSTRNAIRLASEAEEQGRASLSRLGRQSEKLGGIEKNLNVSTAHAREAEDKTKELQKLNRTIFAVHVRNPFTRGKKVDEEREIETRHLSQRAEQDRSREDVYKSSQRVNKALNGESSGERRTYVKQKQYSFEGDEEDDMVERDIDENLNVLGDITGRLKGLAMATKAELDFQNNKLDEISASVSSFLRC
jgi:protein transport protein SEC9